MDEDDGDDEDDNNYSDEDDPLVSRRAKDAPSTMNAVIVEENPTRTLKGTSAENLYDRSSSSLKIVICWPILMLFTLLASLLVNV